MNIYCAGAIKGDTGYREFYKFIIDEVSKLNITALSELNLLIENKAKLTDKEICLRDIEWLTSSSGMIAEVSGASLGVGFEISYALFQLKIPVLAVHHTDAKVSAMITGCTSSLLNLYSYNNEAELKNFINEFINKIKSI